MKQITMEGLRRTKAAIDGEMVNYTMALLTYEVSEQDYIAKREEACSQGEKLNKQIRNSVIMQKRVLTAKTLAQMLEHLTGMTEFTANGG